MLVDQSNVKAMPEKKWFIFHRGLTPNPGTLVDVAYAMEDIETFVNDEGHVCIASDRGWFIDNVRGHVDEYAETLSIRLGEPVFSATDLSNDKVRGFVGLHIFDEHERLNKEFKHLAHLSKMFEELPD